MLDFCMLGPFVLACFIYFGGRGWLALIYIPVTEYHVLFGTFVSSFTS